MIANAPGERCPDYTIQEWGQLEQDMADSWKCGIRQDPSKGQEKIANTDFKCQEGPIETRCLDAEGKTTAVYEGDHGCGYDGQRLIVVGKYLGPTILISTAPRGVKQPLRSTAAGHEMIHSYLETYEGDADATHSEEPGPWKARHDEIEKRLRQAGTLCD